MEPIHHNVKRGFALWQPDFSATLSEDGEWKAQHSFLCHADDAFELTPKTSAATCAEPGFELLQFSGATIQKEEAHIARVTCNYGGTENDEESWEFDDNAKTYELQLSVSQEPLTTHPDYRDEIDHAMIQKIKSGQVVPVIDEQGEWTWEGGDDEAEDLDEKTAIVAKSIIQGQDSYYEPRATWTVTMPSSKRLSDSQLAGFGKLEKTPRGNPPTPAGYDWLFTGATQTKTGGTYSIQLAYLMSGGAGWDANYYDSPPA